MNDVMNDVINMQGVGWQRNHTAILDQINWQVKPGEHWAILGLNGSGKTTLLNMVNGYIWPMQGEVTVLGKVFGDYDLRELRKEIGWVSSSLLERLYPGDLGHNIVISGKYAALGTYFLQPTGEDYERAVGLMKQLGCEQLIGRRWDSCSQGERQRLLIARALMASPRLLIMDEACSGLDFLARESLLSVISELARNPNGPTILFVTHHSEEILPCFNKTLLLRRGQVFAQGNSREILNTTSLSAFFEMPVLINWHNDRAWMSTP